MNFPRQWLDGQVSMAMHWLKSFFPHGLISIGLKIEAKKKKPLTAFCCRRFHSFFACINIYVIWEMPFFRAT